MPSSSSTLSEEMSSLSNRNFEFWSEIDDDHLVPHGLLADQAAMDDIPVGIYVLEKDGLLISCMGSHTIAKYNRKILRCAYPSISVWFHHATSARTTISRYQ
jgi:hypothetical protein